MARPTTWLTEPARGTRFANIGAVPWLATASVGRMSLEQQQPIGSGFGARTTAEEVLGGIDLTGKLAVVTGGYSGLGLEITKALTNHGAHVVVPARRPEAAHDALEGIEHVEITELDLADQASVAAFADAFLASGRSIDFLIGNAGVMASPEDHVTINGTSVESQLATNHLGHFALANRLWPALAADGGARVVSVSSGAHLLSPIRWDDLDFASGGYDKWKAYGQAKTANVLFALQLDELGKDAGVRAFSLHPGGIITPLQRHIPRDEQIALGWIDEDGNPKDESFKTPEQGAATATWAATSPQLGGLGGLYLVDVDVAAPRPSEDAREGVAPYAVDPDEAARLWAWSAEITGVDAFADAGVS